MESAMEAIKALLHNKADNQINAENLVKQDIMTLLKKCITDFDIAVKEPALHIVSTLLKVSSLQAQLQRDLYAHNLLPFCIKQVHTFPCDDVDEDVLMHAVEIIQLGVPGSQTNMDVVTKMNGLKEIAIQLKIYM